jgi:hypothetical protein
MLEHRVLGYVIFDLIVLLLIFYCYYISITTEENIRMISFLYQLIIQ